jgi:hypothetical protein
MQEHAGQYPRLEPEHGYCVLSLKVIQAEQRRVLLPRGLYIYAEDCWRKEWVDYLHLL